MESRWRLDKIGACLGLGPVAEIPAEDMWRGAGLDADRTEAHARAIGRPGSGGGGDAGDASPDLIRSRSARGDALGGAALGERQTTARQAR